MLLSKELLFPYTLVCKGSWLCTSDVEEKSRDASQRILFGVPTLSVETRSTFKNALSAGDEFGVLGYCVPYTVSSESEKIHMDYTSGGNPWALKKAHSSPEVFYNQRVVVGTGGCTYDRTGGGAKAVSQVN